MRFSPDVAGFVEMQLFDALCGITKETISTGASSP